jgi:hypothetical protein
MAGHHHEHKAGTSHGSKSGGGVHGMLGLPDHGERFEEEWAVTRGRIERVSAASVPRETEPAGAPRLQREPQV